MERKNIIVDLSVDLSLEIIKFSEELEKERKYVIAKQIIRSGTSVGANIHEAQSAESKADFIHKLKISDKELNETAYWLKLCQQSPNYPKPQEALSKLMIDIKNVLSKIIISSKRGGK